MKKFCGIMLVAASFALLASFLLAGMAAWASILSPHIKAMFFF